MKATGTKKTQKPKDPKKQTPTFLLELPLVVNEGQAKRLRAHLEVGRQFNNARMWGVPCPKAWESLVPERVCLKVRAKPHQSRLSSSAEESWKRGSTAQTLPCFSWGSLQGRHYVSLPT